MIELVRSVVTLCIAENGNRGADVKHHIAFSAKMWDSMKNDELVKIN